MSTQIKAVSQDSNLMNFIIGKLWLNEGRGGQLVIDRDNPADIVLTPGMRVNLTDQTDKKREGKQDADYSVSILLPKADAIRLIEEKKSMIATRKADQE